jgi:alkylhydroperoxidase/carboxymuconolactone decarboxylase family protein YurZ
MRTEDDSGGQGLDARTRQLCLCMAAVGPADWTGLAAALVELRRLDAPRAEAEEALLQATLFFGFPRLVTAFEELDKAWPTPAGAAPRRPQALPGDAMARGRAVFAAVYGKHDAAVRARLEAFHPDFHDFVLESAYGRILCRDGIDLCRRELLATTALAALRQEPQLVAHSRAALAMGATAAAVREALQCTGAGPEEFANWCSRIGIRPD